MIVLANNLVLTPGIPAGTPLIGWHNVVTAAALSSTTAFAGFPVSNLANPSTNLVWIGNTNPNDEVITAQTNYSSAIDYVGIARHNFGSNGNIIAIEGADPTPFQKLLLHFDVNYSDVFGHVFTPDGSGGIDAANKKFGAASLFFGGGGGTLNLISTPSASDLNLGSADWTIDFWTRLGSLGVARFFCGRCNSTPTAAGSSFRIGFNTAGRLTADVFQGSSTISMVGTTVLSTVAFQHVALFRRGNTLFLTLNGAIEATASITGAVNDPAIAYAIGLYSTTGGGLMHGWIDEYRHTPGMALWSGAFTPPDAAQGAQAWRELVQQQLLPDDAPIILRWNPTVLTHVRVRLKPGASIPFAAVMYVGKLLVCERGLDINPTHVPLKYGRKVKQYSGFSEAGNFLGRVVLQERRESKAEFKWLTPAWWRSEFDPFIRSSQTSPFFFAWNPVEYPLEAGFAWMTNDPVAETDPVTRRIHTTLEMRGVA